MSELRWVLLVAGLIAFGLVVFVSVRRGAGGEQSRAAAAALGRREPGLHSEAGAAEGALSPPAPTQPVEKAVTIRLMARAGETFSAEALVLALRENGLRHGQYGIFHRYHESEQDRSVFSVASLVEPGTFDLTRLKTDRYPGISLFFVLPGAGDGVAAFDDMLSTARSLAASLDGDLLDEQGSRLSVQRERYLREEVIQFMHQGTTG